jgi:hypothetical protein
MEIDNGLIPCKIRLSNRVAWLHTMSEEGRCFIDQLVGSKTGFEIVAVSL